jgi:hypothetical protein
MLLSVVYDKVRDYNFCTIQKGLLANNPGQMVSADKESDKAETQSRIRIVARALGGCCIRYARILVLPFSPGGGRANK